MSRCPEADCRTEIRHYQTPSPQQLARVRDWIEREISFVDHPGFAKPEFESSLSLRRPDSLDELPGLDRGLDRVDPGRAFLSGMVESRLLTPEEETYLFTRLNFLKFRAERTRQKLSLNAPNFTLVNRIEREVAEATEIRNQVVKSNLRLVVATARKLVSSLDLLSELIGEGMPPLIRSVELFDVSLGYRFSTYATWAVRNHLLRCLKRRRQLGATLVYHEPVWLGRVADYRGHPSGDIQRNSGQSQIVEQLLKTLSKREYDIVAARFGLDGQPRGQSLQDIARQIGLSKERVRQILIRTMTHLRDAGQTIFQESELDSNL